MPSTRACQDEVWACRCLTFIIEGSLSLSPSLSLSLSAFSKFTVSDVCTESGGRAGGYYIPGWIVRGEKGNFLFYIQ